MSHARRAARGLTLIELALAVALLALLSALALPVVNARMAREQLHKAAEMLQADLSEARFQAAQQGLPMTLSPQSGAQACWSVSTAPGCACATAQPCQIRRAMISQFRGVQLLQGEAVTLTPDGGAAAQRVALLQDASGTRLAVRVGVQGRPQICAVGTEAELTSGAAGQPGETGVPAHPRYPPC